MNEPFVAPQIPGFHYVRPLGKGGFARVYLYEQDMPRRIVAVKVLTKAVGEMREAFETEADMMAKLATHPSIVSLYQASISPEGHPYLVMEFCPDALGAKVKQRPLPLEAVLDAGVRLAGALETAHRGGVLHRDIKPSNVLLSVTGKPQLTDFGIADLADRDTSEQTEMAMSIPWSAPEVVTKVETGTVASEVWSLAATLYTFAAGRSPFAGQVAGKDDVHRALTQAISRAEFSPIAGASGYEAFETVLARAMQRDPSDRYPSMAVFGRALQEVQRHYEFDVTPMEIVNVAWLPEATPRRHPDPQNGGSEDAQGIGTGAQNAGHNPAPVYQSRAQRRAAEQAAAAADRHTAAASGRSEGSRSATPRSAARRVTARGGQPSRRRLTPAVAFALGSGTTAVVLGGVYVLGRSVGWL